MLSRRAAPRRSCRAGNLLCVSVWLCVLVGPGRQQRAGASSFLRSFGVLSGHGSPTVASASPPAAAPMEIPGDDDSGVWRWDMPERQQDLAVGGDGERVCMNCAGSQVVQGISAAKLKGVWVAFFCRQCSPHLSVRNNAQVPVMWTGPTANITGDLTMLPLYKRCRRCRRWAGFGPPGVRGVKRHCRSHAPPSEVPVHRRECGAPGCKKRPSFAAVGEGLPLRCAMHKTRSDMDVSHSRCIYRTVKDGASVRCWRVPTYGFKQGRSGGQTRSGKSLDGTGIPRMCWEHTSEGMVQVLFGKCRQKDCKSHPIYARPAERKLSYCKEHHRDGDVCTFEGQTEGGEGEMGERNPVSEAFPTFSSSSPLPNITLSSSRRHRSDSSCCPS